MAKSDPTLEALKKDPQAAQLLSDPAGLKALLGSPETKKLIELLNQQGGDGLQSAAKAAATGKPEALMGLLNQVMNTQEGSQAVEGRKKKTQK